MSEVVAMYQRVHTAYERPTLALLTRPTSPALITILRLMFTTEKPTVATARMHDQVDDLLADMRRENLPNIPQGNGRDNCLKWMHDGWLMRSTDDAGNEHYSLSSAALDALRTIERLTTDRTITLSSYLIEGLVRHLRDFAAALNPDNASLLSDLHAEKDRIQAEIDHLLGGGTPRDVSDDAIVQGVAELQRYLLELPSDFTRVVESYRDFERETITAFRTDQVSTGDAVARYLHHVEELTTASAAGRAYESALQLLRDPAMLEQIRRHITTLLDSPRASALLIPAERAQVRNTVTLISDGLTRVRDQRAKVARTLHDYITSHDVQRDHELAATLAELETQLHAWMATAGPRTKAPMPLLPGKPDIAHLRTKMYDPADDQPPPPLVATTPPATLRAPTLSELRARGGPSHSALSEHLLDSFTTQGGVDSLAQLFHALPDDLRRPVEILGLLPLARRHGLAPTGETETYQTIRPDGTQRTFQVPRYAHPPAATGTTTGTGPAASTGTGPSTNTAGPDTGMGTGMGTASSPDSSTSA